MVTQRQPQRKRIPAPGAGNPGMPLNPIAQGVSIAMFAASQDSCQCRACMALRKVLSEMTDEYLKGGR